MKKIIYLLCFLIFSLANSQETYSVIGNNINIREYPNKNSNIVGKLKKGDKVEVIEIQNGGFEVLDDWAKIKFNENEYFVVSKYLSKSQNKDIGFGEGFGTTYIYSAGIIALLLTLPEVLKRRVSDRRFKQGFRQDKVPETTMWKNILIAAVVALPIGLIGGLICWIM